MQESQKPEITDAQRMVTLLHEQNGVFEALHALAAKQRKLIASGDTEPLLKILAQRQRLTADLQRLGKAMAPLRANWAALRSTLARTAQVEIDGLIAAANDSLAGLLQTDEEDARMLQLRKKKIGEDLSTVRSGQHAVSAYRATASAGPHLERMHEES